MLARDPEGEHTRSARVIAPLSWERGGGERRPPHRERAPGGGALRRFYPDSSRSYSKERNATIFLLINRPFLAWQALSLPLRRHSIMLSLRIQTDLNFDARTRGRKASRRLASGFSIFLHSKGISRSRVFFSPYFAKLRINARAHKFRTKLSMEFLNCDADPLRKNTQSYVDGPK